MIRALQQHLVNGVFGNERISRGFGLNVTDGQVLHLLLLRPEVDSAQRIAAATGLPTSSVTHVVDRLERAGYLRRESDPADRRRLHLRLDPEAIAPIAAVYAGRAGMDEVFAEFNGAELAVVARFLELSARHFAP